MLRMSKWVCVVVSLVLSSSAAAETARYTAAAEVTRENGAIVVSIRLTETRPANDPAPDGRANEITTTHSPRVRLEEGKRASIAFSKTPVQKKDARPADEIESGYDVKIISVKGQDKVLMVAAAIERGEVVWAESETIRVTDAAPTGKAPDIAPPPGK